VQSAKVAPRCAWEWTCKSCVGSGAVSAPKRTPAKPVTSDLRQRTPVKQEGGPASSLLVDKYRPRSVKQIIGQQGERSCVNKLLHWLRNWNAWHVTGSKEKRLSPSSHRWGGSQQTGRRCFRQGGRLVLQVRPAQRTAGRRQDDQRRAVLPGRSPTTICLPLGTRLLGSAGAGHQVRRLQRVGHA